MKKIIVILICTSVVLCGCKNTSSIDEIIEQNSTAETVLLPDDEGTKSTTATSPAETTEVSVSTQISPADTSGTETEAPVRVDLDLTVLSGQMVYAEVYNIMVTPEDYVGKVIKIRGSYYSYYVAETDMIYHFVVNSDAAACCQQGLEFIWDDNTHTYPDEYPEQNAEIEVTGVFGSYEELGNTYYYLAVDSIAEN